MDLDPAPFNIETEVADISQLKLTWETDQRNIQKYRIYRGSKAGGPYTLIGESTKESFVDGDTGLQEMHYYVVTQVIGGKESDFSGEHIDSWFYNFQGGKYPHPEKEKILENLDYKD
jgi:fibronectin type 3 domain-containing protein